MSQDDNATTGPDADGTQWAVGELYCPDGTKFVMYSDGNWGQEPWDGSATFRTNSDCESVTAADLAEYRPERAWRPTAK